MKLKAIVFFVVLMVCCLVGTSACLSKDKNENDGILDYVLLDDNT